MAFLLAVSARADLAAIKAERNLEKRAGKALDHAAGLLKSAQQDYSQGRLTDTNAALDELGQSVELAYQSLVETGKNPSRSPKHFKRAEIRTREFLRQLTDFREQMSLDDRGELDRVRAAVQKAHDELLQGIMGGKKKR